MRQFAPPKAHWPAGGGDGRVGDHRRHPPGATGGDMAGIPHIGANLAGPLTPASWPALCRPSTTCGAETGKDVDGRAKPGHDTVGTTVSRSVMLAPMGTRPAMTERDWACRPSRPLP